MKGSQVWSLVVGVLLVLAGAIGALQISGIIDLDSAVGEAAVFALFALGGIAFLVAFATKPRDRWAAAIPGLILLALGALGFFDNRLGEWGGLLFLGSIGLAFLLVYFARPEFWWALIPAGVLLTLGVEAGLDAAGSTNDELQGTIFFLGLAATFLAVYATQTADGKRRGWALVTALVLGALGVLVGLVAAGLLDENATVWLYVGPAFLILGGGFLVLRTLMRKESGEAMPAVKN